MRVLVIGGGNVALRKVKDLLNAGVSVEGISPKCIQELISLIKSEHLPWNFREYQDGDIHGFSLVIVATDNQQLNTEISNIAREAGIPVNVVDQPDLCTTYFTAVVREDPLLLSISTGGAAPFFARELKKKLNQWIKDEGLDIRAKWAEKIRLFALKEMSNPEQREIVFSRFMDLSKEEILNWDMDQPPLDLWRSWMKD